jgi:uncharacterized membrane protein
MEMRVENKSRSGEERTLKDLAPNVAALLCYVAGWISGIVFLILEQKNRFIRFHALQSIIVFGSLALAGVVLGNFPGMGPAFSVIIGITGFVLWIILMVKAINGEVFKVPWAGNLAEKLANESEGQNVSQSVKKEGPPDHQSLTPAENLSAPVKKPSKGDIFRAGYYSMSARSGRAVVSAVAIAWSVALLIFFNFYSQYIAYYEPQYSGGATHWQMHTLITSAFTAWLPILTVTLVLTIIGHAVLMVFDKYVVRQIVRIVLDAFGAATVITLLTLFPFDFSLIPNTAAADGATIGVTVALIFMAIGFSVGALVKFIKLIINVAEGKY